MSAGAVHSHSSPSAEVGDGSSGGGDAPVDFLGGGGGGQSARWRSLHPVVVAEWESV
jgi:hypothetical protein